MNEKVMIRNIRIGDGYEPVFIAGPCVIENISMLEETADFLEGLNRFCKVIMKISYDKANRTSGGSFRGPGLEKGIKMIAKVRDKYELPILVDVHCRNDIKQISDYCDVIQIPAFLCRQTDLLIEAAKTGMPVNIKKGQFMSPWSMHCQVEKITKLFPDAKVILTERGTSFGYGELIVDFRSIIIMKQEGTPVFFDATHSQQCPPAGSNKTTAGRKEFIIPLAKAARSVGADGIYCEIHPNPELAKSDRETQLSFSEFEVLVNEVSKMQKEE